MPKKPFINRKDAKHYHVVHRSQKDPLINDENASQRVLQEFVPSNILKHKTQEEIQSVHHRPTQLTQDEIDEKVGQAALYGVYFDDSEYDYTQHLRPIGATDAVFLEAPSNKKEKQPATGGINFVDESVNEELHRKDRKVHLPEGVLPSDIELYTPKMPLRSIDLLEGGLQPDMDPRLREIMEALDDDAYVEDGAEDFFGNLNAPGERYEPDEYDDEEEYYEEEYYEDEEFDENVPMPSTNWQAAFKQFKKEQRAAMDSDDEDDRRSGVTGMTRATTASHRNANLTLLDERFEKIEEEYEEDESDFFDSDEEDEEPMVAREDFNAILDDFLDKYEVVGKKMVPRLEGDTSEAKLDSIRNALGAARLSDDENETPMPSRPTKNNRVEGVDIWERPVKQRATWDCQTVLSTYSNLENHPRLIKEESLRKRIQIDPKTGMPILVEIGKKQKASGKSRLREQVEEENEENEQSDSEEEERGK
ncbi:Low temperature viability protein-domain-containing protein [Umbelopsis sp. PMI_123]|nr:Low temperature viability protein-domain-containing protein [Umbelopsis sp. PMI_123]